MVRINSICTYIKKSISFLVCICITCILFTACTQTVVDPVVAITPSNPNTTGCANGITEDISKEKIKEARDAIVSSWYAHTDIYNALAEEMFLAGVESGEMYIVFGSEYDSGYPEIEEKGRELLEKTGINYDSLYSSPDWGEWIAFPSDARVFRYKIPYIFNGEPAAFCWLDLVKSSNWDAFYHARFGEIPLEDNPHFLKLNDEWGIILNYYF